MREPTDTELAYCAGVLDSDGHIGVHVNWYKVKAGPFQDSKQPTYQPRCSVKQLDHQAVELFGELFGGHFYADNSNVRGSRRPINTWSVHSRATGVVVAALLPHLRIKRRQAQLALDLCALNASPRRHQFVLPEIVEGEPLLPILEAAALAGRSRAVAYQSVKLRNIPFVKVGQRVMVPASYVDEWRTRPAGACRHPDVSAAMEKIAVEMKSLNSGKRGQAFVTPRRYA